MVKVLLTLIAVCSCLCPCLGAGAPSRPLGDWPEARGANRDGISQKTGLPFMGSEGNASIVAQ